LSANRFNHSAFIEKLHYQAIKGRGRFYFIILVNPVHGIEEGAGAIDSDSRLGDILGQFTTVKALKMSNKIPNLIPILRGGGRHLCPCYLSYSFTCVKNEAK
jgi:hypothetical protein